MGFKEGDFPPVDPATFRDQPLQWRIKTLVLSWVDIGFGTPKMLPIMYFFKVLINQVIIGVLLATLTSGLNPLHFSEWWDQPIVYQKLLLWTVFIEVLGIAGAWGPLTGHFKPMTGGVTYWLRPGTIRLPPWPDTVPGTKGDTRTVLDVVLYVAILVNLLVAVLLPGKASSSFTESIEKTGLPIDASHGLVNPAALYSLIVLLLIMGLRDKIVFLAARSEQYVPAMIFFAFLPFVDMIVALKLLIVVVWVGAGISKIGLHFTNVIPPMVSNTPWMPGTWIKRAHYRNFPEDVRPSHLSSFMAHVLGTVVEIAAPLALLFSTNKTLTVISVVVIIAFHAFIFSTFPLAVPLEWNALFAYTSAFLFLGFPAWDGYALTDMNTALLVVIVIALLFLPVLGNFRPDLVSFLPSMRQYAGNWATGLWAFAPGAEEKLDRLPRQAPNTVDQLAEMYGPEAADVLMHDALAWRSMHSQGRGLVSVMTRELGDEIDTWTVRDAEFPTNTIIGWNFGDGHLHGPRLIEAIQKRCDFAPHEFVIVWAESQPVHKKTQEYVIIDAALGIVERGTWNVRDAVEEQPWLPNGPIPVDVAWREPSAPAPAGG